MHDVAAAIADPRSLGVNLLRNEAHGGAWRGEVVSACWVVRDADRIAVLETPSSAEDGSVEDPDLWDAGETVHAGSDSVAVLGVDATVHARHCVGVTPGLLVPCGRLVMNLHTYPSLLDPADGRTIAAWPELSAGETALCLGIGRRAAYHDSG